MEGKPEQGMFGKGQKARNSAMAELREKHAEEFQALLSKHRTDMGLPADADAAKRQKQIDKAKEKLAALGVDVSKLG